MKPEAVPQMALFQVIMCAGDKSEWFIRHKFLQKNIKRSSSMGDCSVLINLLHFDFLYSNFSECFRRIIPPGPTLGGWFVISSARSGQTVD